MALGRQRNLHACFNALAAHELLTTMHAKSINRDGTEGLKCIRC